MNETSDTANVLVPPPVALLLAFLIGWGLDWVFPAKFMPAGWPAALIGAAVFLAGLALAIFAMAKFTQAGTEIPPYRPTTAIVTGGPYGWSRNPIYVGMLMGQAGLAIGFDSLWLVLTWVLLALVLHYGVVVREEAYLERKFGAVYLQYKAAVRRWL